MLISLDLVFLSFSLGMFKKNHSEKGTYGGSSNKICQLS